MFKQNLEMQKIKPSNFFLQGWKLLAGKFGPLGADKFVHIVRMGFGDSVQERKKMWKGSGLKGIVKLLWIKYQKRFLLCPTRRKSWPNY